MKKIIAFVATALCSALLFANGISMGGFGSLKKGGISLDAQSKDEKSSQRKWKLGVRYDFGIDNAGSLVNAFYMYQKQLLTLQGELGYAFCDGYDYYYSSYGYYNFDYFDMAFLVGAKLGKKSFFLNPNLGLRVGFGADTSFGMQVGTQVFLSAAVLNIRYSVEFLDNGRQNQWYFGGGIAF